MTPEPMSAAKKPGAFLVIRRAVASLLMATVLSILTSCTIVEETGRRQLSLMSEETEIQMGVEAYRQAISEATVSTDKAAQDLVRRVGMRIAEASGKSDYQWEFTVLQDDKTVNAWCLPGGKVAVYTGILKVTQNEAGLATVIGHEVAHATSHHGRERMSQTLLVKGGETALSLALQNREPETANMVMAAFGISADLAFLRPYSRDHESEADYVGLKYMARAGYDPEAAVEFWKRMQSMTDASGAPPEFLSTHPSHETRIQNLKEWLPEAKAEFRPIR